MYHVEGEVNNRGKKKADRSVEKNDLESWSRLDSREVSSATNKTFGENMPRVDR